MNEPFAVKRRVNLFAKNIDSGQPAQSSQDDQERNSLHIGSFLDTKGPYYLMIHLIVNSESKSVK